MNFTEDEKETVFLVYYVCLWKREEALYKIFYTAEKAEECCKKKNETTSSYGGHWEYREEEIF